MKEFGWLKQLIKDMKESLKTGLHFTPTDRDVDNLGEILRKVKSGRIRKVKSGQIRKVKMGDNCNNCKFRPSWMHQYSCTTKNPTWWCKYYEPTLERKLKLITKKYLKAVRKYVEFERKLKKRGKKFNKKECDNLELTENGKEIFREVEKRCQETIDDWAKHLRRLK